MIFPIFILRIVCILFLPLSALTYGTVNWITFVFYITWIFDYSIIIQKNELDATVRMEQRNILYEKTATGCMR